MFGEQKIYLSLDFLNFPIAQNSAPLHIFIPSAFLCMITLIFCMLIFFYPFRNFTITTSKTYRFLSSINTTNLRMLFHMQKNIFVAISKFSQLSLEDCQKYPQTAYEQFKTIKNLSDNTIDCLTKNLNYLKDIEKSKECVSIYRIINDALAKSNIPKKIIVDKIYPAANLECYLNLEAITECFVNIISNALEAIELAQNDSGKITIIIDYDYDLISINITDNGCGIEKKDIKHIFKPLFSTKSSQKNYGLGLSYTKRVIQKNNGYIQIKSKPNTQTIVQIILPKYNKRRFNLWKK